MTTLYREIDALGGAIVPGGGHSAGYCEALTDVLALLEKRGHSEHCDPTLDALVALHDAGRTAWHFQHQDTNARYAFATALANAPAAIAKARGEVQP